MRKSQYTAVVHAADGLRFIAAAQQPEELAARLISYVRARCDHTLWPSDARRVHELIDDHSFHAAIGLYFSNIGGRWDVEQLELGTPATGSE